MIVLNVGCSVVPCCHIGMNDDPLCGEGERKGRGGREGGGEGEREGEGGRGEKVSKGRKGEERE